MTLIVKTNELRDKKKEFIAHTRVREQHSTSYSRSLIWFCGSFVCRYEARPTQT